DHVLIIADAILVEHRDHDRSALGFKIDLAEIFERGQEPRHADGKTRRRQRLRPEARNQSVITPAAADRAKAWRSVFAVGGKGQLNFEDCSSVIFEAAANGWIDYNSTIGVSYCFNKCPNCFKFFAAFLADRRVS